MSHALVKTEMHAYNANGTPIYTLPLLRMSSTSCLRSLAKIQVHGGVGGTEYMLKS